MLIKNKNFWLALFLLLLYGILKLHSHNKNNLELAGDKYFLEGNIEKAVECWEKVLKEKNDKRIYEKIVTSYIVRNDLETAKKWTTTGLTNFPNCVNLIFNLGLINFYQAKYSEALKFLDSVLKKDNYFPNAHYLKGLIFEIRGEKEKAKKEYIEEINVNPSSKKAWEKIKELKNEKS